VDDLERARELLKKARRLYEPWKAECEALVTRWEWGSSTRHNLEPCWFEVHKFAPGRLLPGEPKRPTSGVAGHGFDAGGRLVVTRRQTEFPGRIYEEFARFEDDRWEVLYFDYDEDKRGARADVYRLEGGRVVRISTAGANKNHFVQVHRHDGAGRVVEIERTGRNAPYPDVHDFRDLEYDAKGRIVRVWWRFPDGRKLLDFERPAASETFDALRATLRKAIGDAIVEFLRKQKLESPAYAVALAWCSAEYQHMLPPSVMIGLESERKRFLEEQGRKAASFLWSPAEWKLEGAPKLTKALARKAELANQDIWQNEIVGEGESFIRELAADLAKRDLPIPKTDDFVVYATNLDLDQGADDVREQAPKRQVARLRKRGFLEGS
jgi:hypothetical protein